MKLTAKRRHATASRVWTVAPRKIANTGTYRLTATHDSAPRQIYSLCRCDDHERPEGAEVCELALANLETVTGTKLADLDEGEVWSENRIIVPASFQARDNKEPERLSTSVIEALKASKCDLEAAREAALPL